jgi:hypothetical protein
VPARASTSAAAGLPSSATHSSDSPTATAVTVGAIVLAASAHSIVRDACGLNGMM